MDALKKVEMLDEPATDVPGQELKDVLESGYGIFAGKEVNWATLRFTPERARWISRELWHPKQKAEFLPDGSFELKVPYSDDRELIMDILKHGADVKVIEPDDLRDKLKAELGKALALYL